MTGQEIKEKIKASGMKQWEVAEKIGVAEFTLCRKLRKPTVELEQKIMEVIGGQHAKN